MAQEVGSAYVTLLPSAKGFGKAVEGEMSSAYGAAEKQGKGFFSRLAGFAKVAGVAVAGVVGVIGGLALKGGISRALNIEDAQAKLRGLGHDAKTVEQIMTDALASVKGTAFGLDQAATIAASAVAAGIKPGQELEKYLKLTADAATIAGVSLGEMGAILNKTTATGKVYTENLNQLAERGIPIFQWLAEEYDVTQEALTDMVRAGKVDAETFRKVIEENIGGAALESGATTRGAFANVQAALSRLGVAFVGDGLDGARTFFNELIIIIDGVTERVKPWIADIQSRLGSMFEIEGMGERTLAWIDGLGGRFQPFLDVLADLKGPLGFALGALAELGREVGPEVTAALGDLVVAIAPLIPPLVEMAVMLLPPLVDLLVLLVDVLKPIVPVLADMAGNTTEALKAIQLFFDFIAGEFTAAGFVAELEKIPGPVGDMIRISADAGRAFVDMRARILDVLRTLREAWDNFGLFLGDTLRILVGLVTGNTGLMAEGLSRFGTRATEIFRGLRDSVLAIVQTMWDRTIGRFVSGVAEAVGSVETLPQRILGVFSNARTLLFNVGSYLIQGLINGVRSMISQAVAAVRNVGGAMLDGVKSFLGIQSPSRVFRDEVGQMIGEGIAVGVDATKAQVNASVNHLVQVPQIRGTPGAGASNRPIYADGIGLIGWIREVANGEAQLVWNMRDGDREMTLRGRVVV